MILLDMHDVPGTRAAALDGATLTEHDIQLVQTTFGKIEPIANAAATVLYDRLFELDPEIKPLSKGVRMDRQRKKLMQTIGVAVKEPPLPLGEGWGEGSATWDSDALAASVFPPHPVPLPQGRGNV